MAVECAHLPPALSRCSGRAIRARTGRPSLPAVGAAPGAVDVTVGHLSPRCQHCRAPGVGRLSPSRRGHWGNTDRSFDKESAVTEGTVRWFDADRGFGFIALGQEAEDLYVHASEIVSDDAMKLLREGQVVEFEIGEGDRGPQARRVRVTADQAADTPLGVLGTVAWYEPAKGYGFITPDGGGAEIFVHSSAIVAGGVVSEGQRVAFLVVDGEKGPQADHLLPLGAQAAQQAVASDGADGTVSWYDGGQGLRVHHPGVGRPRCLRPRPGAGRRAPRAGRGGPGDVRHRREREGPAGSRRAPRPQLDTAGRTRGIDDPRSAGTPGGIRRPGARRGGSGRALRRGTGVRLHRPGRGRRGPVRARVGHPRRRGAAPGRSGPVPGATERSRTTGRPRRTGVRGTASGRSWCSGVSRSRGTLMPPIGRADEGSRCLLAGRGNALRTGMTRCWVDWPSDRRGTGRTCCRPPRC